AQAVICAVYGTTGELIKLWPVLRGIEERGGRFVNATTAQQVAQIPGLLAELGLRQPDVYFAHGHGGKELHTNRDIPPWLAADAAHNVRRGVVVDTGMNTIRDSLELAAADVEVPSEVSGGPFGLVSIHRYELLNDEALLRETLKALASHPAQRPMLFVEHPV